MIAGLQANGTEESDIDATDEIEVRLKTIFYVYFLTYS